MRHDARVRAGALLLALCLLATLGQLGRQTTVRAQIAADATPYTVYLPWVPNGETLDGVGPWYGVLSFQNLSDNSCSISVYVASADTGTWANKAQISLTGGATRSVRASGLAVPAPGAPVRLQALCPIAASLKQTTPSVGNPPWSDGADGVTGYTALAQADIDASRATATSAWYLPIAQTNSDWNTFIRVSNLSSIGSTDATVEFYPAGNPAGAAGLALTLTTRIGVAKTWTIDALNVLEEAGWVGYVRITSTREIGVLAMRSKPSAQLTLTNVGVAADAAQAGQNFVSGAPLLFDAYNGWNTGINLANVSDAVASVVVEYYPVGEAELRHEVLTLAPRSMQFIYTPGNVAQHGFVGSATILSDAPVVAAIDEVKYETTEGLSYLAGSVAQVDGAVPIVFREDPSNSLHDNSGINVANLNHELAQSVTIQFYTSIGNPILDTPLALTLPPGGNNYVYLPFIDAVDAGVNASARVTASDPLGVTVISNDVNYAVAGDGSLVLVGSGMDGYYHLQPQTPQ
jgi:hypothetical protein